MKWSNRTCRMIETDLLSSKHHHTQKLPVLPFFHRRQHAQWFVRSEEFGDMQEWLSSEKNTTERTLFPLKRWHKYAARDNLLLHWLILMFSISCYQAQISFYKGFLAACNTCWTRALLKPDITPTSLRKIKGTPRKDYSEQVSCSRRDSSSKSIDGADGLSLHESSGSILTHLFRPLSFDIFSLLTEVRTGPRCPHRCQATYDWIGEPGRHSLPWAAPSFFPFLARSKEREKRGKEFAYCSTASLGSKSYFLWLCRSKETTPIKAFPGCRLEQRPFSGSLFCGWYTCTAHWLYWKSCLDRAFEGTEEWLGGSWKHSTGRSTSILLELIWNPRKKGNII